MSISEFLVNQRQGFIEERSNGMFVPQIIPLDVGEITVPKVGGQVLERDVGSRFPVGVGPPPRVAGDPGQGHVRARFQ